MSWTLMVVCYWWSLYPKMFLAVFWGDSNYGSGCWWLLMAVDGRRFALCDSFWYEALGEAGNNDASFAWSNPSCTGFVVGGGERMWTRQSIRCAFCIPDLAFWFEQMLSDFLHIWFAYLSVCLSVYLSIYLPIYLPICLPTYLSVCPSLPTYPSIHPSIYLSIYPSIHLSICPSIRLSIYASFHLSIYPSIHLSTYPSVIYLSIYRSIYLSMYLLSINQSINLSIYQSIYQSFYHSIYLCMYPVSSNLVHFNLISILILIESGRVYSHP